MADTIFSASFSIVLILLVRKMFLKQVPARFLCALWLIPTCQLLLFGHSLYSDTGVLYNLANRLGKTPLQRIAPDMYDVLEQNLNRVVIQGESFVPGKMTATEITMVQTGISVWEVMRILWVLGVIITGFLVFVPNFCVWRKLRRNRQRKPEVLFGKKVYFIKNLSQSFLFLGKIYIDMEQKKNEEQLPLIVRHEAMHQRGGDDLWNLLRVLCVTLYWFHPLVWVAAFVSKIDCEYACDERTMCHMTKDEKILYGKTLLELTTKESFHKKQGFASFVLGNGKLRERIKRITAKEIKGKTVKKAAFFVCASMLMISMGIFSRYGFVCVGASEQYKKIAAYSGYPLSDQIHADRVTYGDGQLYTMIKSDTNDVPEVTDKWLEKEDNGQYRVVIKKNLQTKDKAAFHYDGRNKVVFHLGGKDTIEADQLTEPGQRYADVCCDWDAKLRFLVDSLTEVFETNYNKLGNGRYRMNYVLWYRSTNEYELFQVPFSVQEN